MTRVGFSPSLAIRSGLECMRGLVGIGVKAKVPFSSSILDAFFLAKKSEKMHTAKGLLTKVTHQKNVPLPLIKCLCSSDFHIYLNCSLFQ